MYSMHSSMFSGIDAPLGDSLPVESYWYGVYQNGPGAVAVHHIGTPSRVIEVLPLITSSGTCARAGSVATMSAAAATSSGCSIPARTSALGLQT